MLVLQWVLSGTFVTAFIPTARLWYVTLDPASECRWRPGSYGKWLARLNIGRFLDWFQTSPPRLHSFPNSHSAPVLNYGGGTLDVFRLLRYLDQGFGSLTVDDWHSSEGSMSNHHLSLCECCFPQPLCGRNRKFASCVVRPSVHSRAFYSGRRIVHSWRCSQTL